VRRGVVALFAALGCTAQVGPAERSNVVDARQGGAPNSGASGDATSEAPAAESGRGWEDVRANETEVPEAGSDAGVTVEAGVESGTEAGVSCPGLFCEDFERGTLDTAVWSRTSVSPGNTITVQSTSVAHGS